MTAQQGFTAMEKCQKPVSCELISDHEISMKILRLFPPSTAIVLEPE
jgi:hypothetical protein